MNYQQECPSEEDLFESSGHSNTAKAIENVILDQSNIHTIGLEGELGSGKSTILKLLERRLPSEKYKFITFDVEQFHYSSTKASFIKHLSENFIELFGTNGSLTDSKRRKRKIIKATDKALGNDLTYTKNIKSNLSWYTVFFAISLMFSIRYVKESISYVISTATTLVSNHELYTFGLNETITSILGFSPLILIGLMSQQKKREKNKPKEEQKVPDIGDIFKRNSRDTITEKLKVTREVGTSELKYAFQSIVSVIPENQCVILVIDNLDRVDKDKVREIWSDLEIFTSFGGENLRIIVPFSEKHVAKALSNDKADDNDGSEFILKRIPVKFRTPPVVSAGWRSPFEFYWNETLPNFEGIELCAELIDIWIAPYKQITPRFLKSHINELAAVLSSNPEAVSPVSCSAYLLSQLSDTLSFTDIISSISNIEKNEDQEIKQQEQQLILLTQKVLRKTLEDEEWSSQIMSIHYQTSIDIAQSELLDAPLKRAISQHDLEEVVRLSAIFGFDVAFKRLMGVYDPNEFVMLASEADFKLDVHRSLLGKWIPQINLYLEQYKNNCLGYDSSVTESCKTLITEGFNISTKRLVAEHDVIKNNASSNKDDSTLLKDQLFQLYEIEEVIGYENIPRFINKPKVKYYMDVLWPMRSDFPLWEIPAKVGSFDLQILLSNVIIEDDFNVTNDLIIQISHSMKIGLVSFHDNENKKISKIRSYNDFEYDESDFPQVLLCSDFCSVSTSLLLCGKLEEYSDSDYINGWVALSIVSVISSDALERSYKNTTMIDYVLDNYGTNDKVLEYIELFMSFTRSYKKLLLSASSDKLPREIKELIYSYLSKDRVNSLTINDITNKFYPLMKEFLSDDVQVKTLSSLRGWKRFVDDGDFLNWNIDFISDCLSIDEEWRDFIIEQFDSNNNSQEFWVSCISKSTSQIQTVVNWYVQQGKKIKNSSDLSSCLIENYGSITTTSEQIHLVNSIMNILPSNSYGRVKRGIASNFLDEQLPDSEKYLLIEKFKKHLDIPKFESGASKSTVVRLIENASSQNVADWLDLQYENINAVEWGEHSQELSQAVKNLSEQYEVDSLSSFIVDEEVEDEDTDTNSAD